MSKLVRVEEYEARRLEPEDDLPKIGSWFWITEGRKAEEDEDSEISEYEQQKYDEPGRKWLACVVDIGSNHIKVKGVRLNERIAIDDFHKRAEPEPDPDSYIGKRVGLYKGNVKELMGEVQRVCALLGITPKQALNSAPDDGNNALAVAHGTADVNAHKNALVKAKEKTLPDLFKQIEAEHEKMAVWMKAQLIPSMASLETMKGSIGQIEQRIFTVELYAGLTESLELVREGEPAGENEKVRLLQNRLYMDEECLVMYEAGGMSFEEIGDFEKWLSRPVNFKRILPFERCIVAFRVRRFAKEYHVESIADFITFLFASEANKATFMYIRNGEQLWRMRTAIEFGSNLFPSKENEELLADDEELWISPHEFRHEKLKTKRQVDAWRLNYQEQKREHEAKMVAYKREMKEYKAALPAWEKEHKRLKKIYDATEACTTECAEAGKAVREHENKKPHWPSEPWFHGSDDWKHYRKLTPDHLYYDDAMQQIKDAANEHNRIAVIVQGLLDRSPCLQPHPPWRIWTPEGFQLGIELIYDYTGAITSGDPPNFEVYSEQLRKSIKVGSVVYGQEKIWMREMAERENARRDRGYDGEYYKPYGNPGPGKLARIVKIRGGKAYFQWYRTAQRATLGKFVESKHRPGWGHYQRDYKKIQVTWGCDLKELWNISAYTPGDFHMFFDDPRTRAGYLKWAPCMLRAEDFHAGKRKVDNEASEDEEIEEAESHESDVDDDDDDDSNDE